MITISDMLILEYDLNLVWTILIFFTVFMIVYNGIIVFLEPHLPTCVLELFRYGICNMLNID